MTDDKDATIAALRAMLDRAGVTAHGLRYSAEIMADGPTQTLRDTAALLSALAGVQTDG